MSGSECCIPSKSMHSSLLSWRDQCLKKLKDQIPNSQNKRSSEKPNRIYDTYKNTVMPHGRHIYVNASNMEKANFFHIHNQIIQYHTENVYCNVVPNFHVLIFLIKKQMISIMTQPLQFVFIFIT